MDLPCRHAPFHQIISHGFAIAYHPLGIVDGIQDQASAITVFKMIAIRSMYAQPDRYAEFPGKPGSRHSVRVEPGGEYDAVCGVISC